MKKNHFLILAAAAAVMLVLVVYFLAKDDKGSERDRKIIASGKDPTLPSGDGMGGMGDDPEEALDRYMKWAQYPPHSRPLFAEMKDLTRPFEFQSIPVGVIEVPAAGCQPTPEGGVRCEKPAKFTDVKCEMHPEKTVSFGKKDMHIMLQCVNKDNVLVPIDGITPRVYTILHNRVIPSPLPPIGFGDDGNNGDVKANDRIYTFLVRPTDQDWGDMFLEADMQVKGHRHNQRVTWYSTPHRVAEFKSGVQDEIKGGSLIVRVPVTILKKGYFNFAANLQQAGGQKEYIASSTWEGDLEAGAQTISFEFFGKIIRDSGKDGPYLVDDIRGRRNNSPVTPSMVKKAMEEGREISGEHKEPLWEFIEPAPAYTTARAYKSDEFSTQEWESDEKRERIRQLKELGTQSDK